MTAALQIVRHLLHFAERSIVAVLSELLLLHLVVVSSFVISLVFLVLHPTWLRWLFVRP